MKAESYYKVTAEVAVRTGMTRTLYRTADGHYVCSARDLRGIRLEPEEYITGIEGVESITYAEAQALIEEGGRSLGVQSSDLHPAVEETPEEQSDENSDFSEQEEEIIPENDENSEQEEETIPENPEVENEEPSNNEEE